MNRDGGLGMHGIINVKREEGGCDYPLPTPSNMFHVEHFSIILYIYKV